MHGNTNLAQRACVLCDLILAWCYIATLKNHNDHIHVWVVNPQNYNLNTGPWTAVICFSNTFLFGSNSHLRPCCQFSADLLHGMNCDGYKKILASGSPFHVCSARILKMRKRNKNTVFGFGFESYSRKYISRSTAAQYGWWKNSG